MENMPGMEGMGHDHNTNTTMAPMSMMHMTFFWGKNAEILFSGWPGKRTGMYVLALVFIFILSIITEWLSHCRWIHEKQTSGVIRTIAHGIRTGLRYLVMLAVMSFNAGVFIVAIAGHTVGFLLFGSRLIFNKSADNYGKDFASPGC